MPINDYFNPNAARPDMKGAPPGLAGFMMAGDDLQYRKAMELQQLLGHIHSQQQQAELNTYNEDAPVRAAKRPADMSKYGLEALMNRGLSTPGNVGAQVAGKVGESQQQAAKGQVAMGTIPGQIAATNAENQGKVSEQKVKGMERMTSFLDANMPLLRNAEKEGPLQAEMKYKQVLGEMPPEIRQHMPQSYSEAKTHLPTIRQKLMMNMETERKLIEEQVKARETGAQRQEQERIRGQYSVDRAHIQFANRLKNPLQILNEAKTPDAQIHAATRILADPDMADFHELAKTLRDQAYRLKAAGLQPRQQPQIPGLPKAPGVSDIVRDLGGGDMGGGSGITIRKYDSQGRPTK